MGGSDHALAKFGCGRDDVLQLALGAGSDDDTDGAAVASASLSHGQLEAQHREIAKLGPAFLAALEIKYRPIAPFINRPKLPRLYRQKALDKLAGEHLALEALRAGLLSDPRAATADEGRRQRALERAAAQEADVYTRSGSAQVYQNLAARCKAADWPPPNGSRPQEEQAYQERLQAEAAARRKEEQLQCHRQSRGVKRLRERAPAAAAAAAASGSAGAARTGGTGRSNVPPQNVAAAAAVVPGGKQAALATARGAPLPQVAAVLEEDDLDWAGAEPEVDQRAAAQAAALRRQVRRRIADQLCALREARHLSAEQRVVVADQCADKVVQRHSGGRGKAALVLDSEALMRLVSQSVVRMLKGKANG